MPATDVPLFWHHGGHSCAVDGDSVDKYMSVRLIVRGCIFSERAGGKAACSGTNREHSYAAGEEMVPQEPLQRLASPH
jgi:hypothetical protein